MFWSKREALDPCLAQNCTVMSQRQEKSDDDDGAAFPGRIWLQVKNRQRYSRERLTQFQDNEEEQFSTRVLRRSVFLFFSCLLLSPLFCSEVLNGNYTRNDSDEDNSSEKEWCSLITVHHHLWSSIRSNVPVMLRPKEVICVLRRRDDRELSVRCGLFDVRRSIPSSLEMERQCLETRVHRTLFLLGCLSWSCLVLWLPFHRLPTQVRLLAQQAWLHETYSWSTPSSMPVILWFKSNCVLSNFLHASSKAS